MGGGGGSGLGAADIAGLVWEWGGWGGWGGWGFKLGGGSLRAQGLRWLQGLWIPVQWRPTAAVRPADRFRTVTGRAAASNAKRARTRIHPVHSSSGGKKSGKPGPARTDARDSRLATGGVGPRRSRLPPFRQPARPGPARRIGAPRRPARAGWGLSRRRPREYFFFVQISLFSIKSTIHPPRLSQNTIVKAVLFSEDNSIFVLKRCHCQCRYL